jgi:hypothetical protein
MFYARKQIAELKAPLRESIELSLFDTSAGEPQCLTQIKISRRYFVLSSAIEFRAIPRRNYA